MVDGRLSMPREADAAGARTAWALSLAGVLPFAIAAVFVLIAGRESLWFDWFVDVGRTYGAIILSFLGGTRWGAGLRNRDAGKQFALSVIPSLAGWMSLFLEPLAGVGFLAFAFAAQGVWDAFSGPPAVLTATTLRQDTLPLWFVKLRVTITFLVVVCLLAMLVALA